MPDDRSHLVAREIFLSILFRNAKQLGWVTRRIASQIEDLHLAAGETLYEVGSAPDYQYFVVTGAVRLIRTGTPDWTLVNPAIIGGFDVILDRPRLRTAIATEPSHLLKMHGKDWLDVLEDSSELAVGGLRSVAEATASLRLRPAPLGGFDEPAAAVNDLGQELTLVERILLLRSVPLLRRVGVQGLTSLAEVAHEVVLATDQVLDGRKGRTRRLFFVATGELEISESTPPMTGRFRAGSLVAGPAAIADSVSYEVRATAPTRVLALRLEDYFDALEEHFDITRSGFSALAEEREMLLSRVTDR